MSSESQAYYRFKDNVFAIVSGSKLDIRKWWHDLRDSAKPFALTCEYVGANACEFLEVKVELDLRNSCYCIVPRVKASG